MSATTISSIRAMAWKEWREQRSVLLGGLTLVIVLPFFLAAGSAAFRGGVDFEGIADALLLTLVCLVWPLFATAAGAGTLAGEIGQGTLDFLLTRPIARRTLWLVKAGTGAATVAAVVACSGAIALAMHAVMSGESLYLPTELQDWYELDGLGAGVVAGALLIFYASAAFFSTFLSRPVTAAAAGLCSSLAILTIAFTFWYRLDVEPGAGVEPMAIHLVGIGLVILAAAMTLFCQRSPASPRRGPLLAGVAVFTALAASPAVVLSALAHLPSESAVLESLALSPSGDLIATTATREDGSSPRVWLVRADGSGEGPLTPRLTTNPVFSPDGEWIGYQSRRSWMGIAARDVALRAIRPDGSDDHLLVGGIPREEYRQSDAIFSPDGSRVALVSDDHLVVGRLGGGEIASASLGGTPAEGGYLLGWTQDGREVLVVSRPSDGDGRRLMAFALSTNEWRTVWETGRYPGFTGWYEPAAGYSHVPFVLTRDDESDDDLILVTVDDGAERTLARGVCVGSVWMLDAGDVIAWAACGTDSNGALVSEIRVLDLATGEEDSLAEVKGKITRLVLSPSRERVFVHRLPSQRWDPLIPAIVSAGGGAKDLPEGWFPIGWSTSSRLIVAQHWEDHLAVADAATGELRQIRP